MLWDKYQREGVIRKTKRLMKGVFFAQLSTVIAQYKKLTFSQKHTVCRSSMYRSGSKIQTKSKKP